MRASIDAPVIKACALNLISRSRQIRKRMIPDLVREHMPPQPKQTTLAIPGQSNPATFARMIGQFLIWLERLSPVA
jgi:hypothetical protein